MMSENIRREIPPCPNCGAKGTLRRVRAYGWCEEHFDEYGEQTEIETDGLKFTASAKVYCDECNHHRKDLAGTTTRVEVRL